MSWHSFPWFSTLSNYSIGMHSTKFDTEGVCLFLGLVMVVGKQKLSACTLHLSVNDVCAW